MFALAIIEFYIWKYIVILKLMWIFLFLLQRLNSVPDFCKQVLSNESCVPSTFGSSCESKITFVFSSLFHFIAPLTFLISI